MPSVATLRRAAGFARNQGSESSEYVLMAMKFRIYIDEVGNPDLECSDDANHRFLSLTGIVLELGYIESVVHPQMEDLKRKFFRHHPDDPVIFHRKELLSGAAPFNILKDQDVRRRFDHELLDLLNAWDYKAISVCLDKKKHKEQYTTWRYDPYHYCFRNEKFWGHVPISRAIVTCPRISVPEFYSQKIRPLLHLHPPLGEGVRSEILAPNFIPAAGSPHL